MRKILDRLICFIVLFFSSCTVAIAQQEVKPIQIPRRNPVSAVGHFVSHHKRFLIMEGLGIGASALSFAGTHHCRVYNSVEACTGNYGAAYGIEGMKGSLSVIVFPAIAEGCWHDDNKDKACWAFPIGASAFNAVWGLHEYSVSGHPKEEKHVH